MKRRIFSVLLVLCMCLMLLPGTVFSEGPKTWYVKETETGTGDGLSWANAKSDLRTVMANAEEGDEIWVAAGTYSPGNNGTDTFPLNKGVKVYGGFAGTETYLEERNWDSNTTTLSGNNNNYHVVTGAANAAPDDTRLDGFTVKLGNADYSYNNNNYGGGMYNVNSSPTVANCSFSSNKADNTGSCGGAGMYNKNSSPRVVNCIFSGNKATSYMGLARGGGMYNDNSSPIVINCSFLNNKAIAGDVARGGGVCNINSGAILVNCTLSGNTASGSIDYGGGGGMYNDNSGSTVVNCTISGNTANSMGGGIYNSTSSLTLANTILWNNVAPNDGDSDIHQSGSALTPNRCVIGKYSGNVDLINSIQTDPNLLPLKVDGSPAMNPVEAYIYGLGTGSSAIDAGLSVGTIIKDGVPVPDVDQRDVPRPNASVDIGAFETVEYYIITFDANGGNGKMEEKKATDGVPFALPANGFTAPTGRLFKAWAIGDINDGAQKDAGEQYTFDANTTVYAIWKDIAVTGVSLNKSTTTLTVGAKETLSATVEPATAPNQNVSWDSDNAAVATVDDNGEVTAIAPGTATITVITDDGDKTATCEVTVVNNETETAPTGTDPTPTPIPTPMPTPPTGIDPTPTPVPTLTPTPSAGTDPTNTDQTVTDPSDSSGVKMTQQPPAWRKGSNEPASFTSDADFKDFLHVKVDDKVVDESNYDAKEGSTIITFKPKFLESLSVGNHSVEIVSASGSAYGNIEIKAESVQQTVEVTKSGDVLPKTGEGSGYYPWLALLLISAGGLILLTGKKRRSQQRD